jgi:LysR family hydrogen peroxide-inducible transcriptional activator
MPNSRPVPRPIPSPIPRPVLRPLPTLRQLRHLTALADHRHFGRAAEACLITQSSLSASLRELETVLGKVLVERSRRRVMVTPLGLEVVARARKILTDVEDLADRVAASEGSLRGELRLGVIPTIGPFLLPRVLPALRRAYPGLRLYLREETSAGLLEKLAAGQLDGALLAFPYETPGMETDVFANDPFWIAFPRGHAFEGRERLSPADLKTEDPLLLEEGHCLRDHALSAVGRAAAGAADDRFSGTSLHTLVQMVDNGLGLTFLPKMAVDAGIAKGTRVGVRPLEGRGTFRRIGLAWRPTSPRKADFALLAGFFRDELATPLPRRRKKSLTKG